MKNVHFVEKSVIALKDGRIDDVFGRIAGLTMNIVCLYHFEVHRTSFVAKYGKIFC